SLDLDFAPQLICTADERHIGRVLEIGEADDAGLAVRRTAIVAGWIAIDPEDTPAAAGQMIERGAPHDAEPAHHDVVLGHRKGVLNPMLAPPCCKRPCLGKAGSHFLRKTGVHFSGKCSSLPVRSIRNRRDSWRTHSVEPGRLSR